MGAVPDEKIPEGEEDNWVPVDLGYSIPEILRIENSPKPPLYFKVNPHYEDTLLLKCPILIWTTLKNMFGPSLMRFQKLSQFLQKIIKNRSNTKMYVLPHGTKSILRLCSNDIFYQERIILC